MRGDELARRTIAQGAVRVNDVVMIEPDRQGFDDGACVRHWIYADVIALDGPHESFRRAVGLRACDGRPQRLQADIAGEGSRLFGDITRAVVAEPFDGVRRTVDPAKARFDG